MIGSQELIEIVHNIIMEQKIPLIDENVYNKLKISKSSAISYVKFIYEKQVSVVQGFLGLADFFHTVVFQDKDKFYIINEKQLYVIESA
jgi:hypothetical protein